MSILAAFYHSTRMACVESIQSCDESIPMNIAFDEIDYCNEPEWSWSWNRRNREARFHYVPNNPFSYQKRPYNPPKLRIESKYKPHVSLHRRCNSGSGWW